MSNRGPELTLGADPVCKHIWHAFDQFDQCIGGKVPTLMCLHVMSLEILKKLANILEEYNGRVIVRSKHHKHFRKK